MKLVLVFGMIVSTIFWTGEGFQGFEHADEGSCGHVQPMNLDDLNIEWALGFAAKASYVPLASKMHFYLMAQTVLQHPPTPEDDLNKLCPLMKTGIFENKVSGFGKTVEMECQMLGLGLVSCAISADKNVPKSNTTLVLSWTDNTKYILTTNCLQNNLKTWNILSTEKHVEDKAMEEIMKFIEKQGFNKNNAISINYNAC